MVHSRAFAGMKRKFFGVRKRREGTFIHNLCPLCGRRRGASSADRVGRDPCVPPRSTHCSRRGTRAPPYRVWRSHGADRVVCPYAPCHCEPVRAAKQVPLGYRLARQSVSPQWKGRIPTPATRSLARNDSTAALQGPLCEGAVGAADWGREKPRDTSPSASASRCHLPRRGRLWSFAPLTNRLGWV